MRSLLLILLSILPIGTFAQTRKTTVNADSLNLNPLNHDVASYLGLDPSIIDVLSEAKGLDKIILVLPDNYAFYINLDAEKLARSKRLTALINELKSHLGEDTEIQIKRHDEVKIGTQDWEPTK